MQICSIVCSWGCLSCRQANSSPTENASALDLTAVFEDCCAFQKTESFGTPCNMNNFDHICQQMSSFPEFMLCSKTLTACWNEKRYAKDKAKVKYGLWETKAWKGWQNPRQWTMNHHVDEVDQQTAGQDLEHLELPLAPSEDEADSGCHTNMHTCMCVHCWFRLVSGVWRHFQIQYTVSCLWVAVSL